MEAKPPDVMPVHGPFGELWFDDRPEFRRWRVRLTDEGRDFVADEIAKWPKGVRLLLWRLSPGTARTAIRMEGAEEVEQHCRIGFVMAAMRYRPGEVLFHTYASQWVRCVVQKEVFDLRVGANLSIVMSRKANERKTGRRSNHARLIRGFLDDPEQFHILDDG